jgi:hypothetical protein
LKIPRKETEVVESEIADMNVIKNKDSLKTLGLKNLTVQFIFYKGI